MSPNLIAEIKINGKQFTKAISPAMTLLEFIRSEVGLTGTKRGCDKGECGCCTVHLNGETVLSCLILAVDVQGEAITTIEGIESPKGLHPVQKEMVDKGAIQCGFCTPAMVMHGVQLLKETPKPSSDTIKEKISGTICRCTGYVKIEKAIESASKIMETPSNE